MNEFYKAVYDIVAQIPRGYVATYGQIAAMLGKPRGARAVGWAMKSMPEYLDLPAYRVVNIAGELSPEYVFGGKDIQRRLLEEEGVTFNSDGKINMDKHLWSKI